MNEPEQFSRLVEKIYDSALDASLWTGALESLCGYVQGCTANLFYQNISTHQVVVFHSWGEDAHYRQLYFEKYAAMNPLFPASSFLEVGTVHAVNDVIPLDEFRETRMYREWVQPQGILDVLYSNLERTATGAAAMAVRRLERDGLFDAEAKARFMLIAPHVRRAVSIGKVIDFHKSNEGALSATLDRVGAAVLLVSSARRVIYANAQAEAMLELGQILRAPKGHLSAVHPAADRELSDAIAAAAPGDAGLGLKGIAIKLTDRDNSSPVAHILPLTSGDRRGMLHHEAVAAVFVYEATRGVPAPLEIVTGLYRLTAGEVRVLAALAEITGVAKIATALGISEATVKTHLQNLFAKTGVRRQSELLKLLARHATALTFGR